MKGYGRGGGSVELEASDAGCDGIRTEGGLRTVSCQRQVSDDSEALRPGFVVAVSK